MSDGKDMEQPLVFGLDIGTRNVVGTVGYRTEDQFIVTAQYIMQHDTRAMLDGQIHDIGRVSGTIRKVKEQLEKQDRKNADGGMYRCRRAVCLRQLQRVSVTIIRRRA